MKPQSLRTKFAYLLAAFGAVVVINAAIVLWGVLFLERQLDEPMRATERALTLLSQVKRAVGAQHNTIALDPRAAAIGPADPESDGGEALNVERLRTMRETAVSAASDLREAENLTIVLGEGVPQYLVERVAQAERQVEAWLDSESEEDRLAALRMLFDIHERIEATESRVVQNAALASAHTVSMRWFVLASFGASVLIALLAGWLAIQLVLRWVLKPVAGLREAAERFARGQLEYRVAVDGNDEIATLASEFNAMAGTISTMQAERIERERLAAFGTATRSIVHNIKSPLSGIRMMAELAGDEAGEGKDKLDRIVSTVDRLNTWLKRLLDLSRPGELNRVSTAIPKWLEEVMAPLKTRAQAAGVDLQFESGSAPERASFDAAQLEQAIVALVSNAIETTPSGGVVRVSAWSENSREAPPRWGLDVADSGPGVSAEAEAQLFRPYFTTKSDGNGIGLAMVQKVARDHGGDAWLRDAGEGRGAVFALWVPLDLSP